jgi:Protein of unknown function (DUF4232)
MKQPAVAAPAAWAKAPGVGLACAALLFVSACGSAVAHLNSGRAVSRTHPPAGVVPWVDRPAPAYTPPAPSSPTGPPAKYVPCAAADLTGRLSKNVGAYMGHYIRYLVLANVSGGPCTLAGAPSKLTGLRADGRRVMLARAFGEGPDPNLIGPANLRPGHSAQVALTTASICPGAPASCRKDDYTAVAVGIGGSGQVPVNFPRGQPLTVMNGIIVVSTFGVPVPPPPEESSPLDVLTVTDAMPRQLTAGATASCTVTLRNPASHPVALRPCPSYEEYVFPVGATLTKPQSDIHRYYLNCQAVSEIPAGGSITFAMRVAVPAISGRIRQAKHGWMLQGTTVVTGGVVTVVAGASP